MTRPPVVGEKVLLAGFSCGNRVIEPQAIGVVEAVRGYGSLQMLEVRTLQGQPGARLRIAGAGQWKPLSTETEELVGSTVNFALNRNDTG